MSPPLPFGDGQDPEERKQHPFFARSEAAFLLARREGKPVGRITVFDNRRFNSYRNRKEARFYHFECAEDDEAAAALFPAASAWARKCGLGELSGPRGFSGMEGSGLLIDGFEHRATMTMMHYHLPYYRRLLEKNNFEKVRDYYTAVIDRSAFQLPEKIRRVAEIHYKRGHFRVPVFLKAEGAGVQTLPHQGSVPR